ncbi:hypothetical protein V6Z11_D06G055500 [Gossypium hirsutum]
MSWHQQSNTTCRFFNHVEIIAMHEASRECVWLRLLTQHIQKICNLPLQEKMSTILYEDNVACIAQLKGDYIKGDRTKHISPKLLFTHVLEKIGDINVQEICSSDNLADLFTKALPTSIFERLLHKIGMHQLKNVM